MAEQLELNYEQEHGRDTEMVRSRIVELDDVKDPRIALPAINETLEEAGYSARIADFDNLLRIPLEDGTTRKGYLSQPSIGKDGEVYVVARVKDTDESIIEREYSLDEIEKFNVEFEAQKHKATQRKARGEVSSQQHNRDRAARFEGHSHPKKNQDSTSKTAPSVEAQQGNAEDVVDPKLEKWAQEALKDVDLFGNDDFNNVMFQELADVRATLAEESVKARRSNLLYSRSRHEAKLKEAISTYKQEREKAFSELIDGFENATTAQKKALLANLSAREDGALMGEEANYYLTKENSWSQRMMDKYKSASKWKKITMGVGATALVSAGAGIVGGAAAIGGILGARVGRGYLNREAGRNGEVRSLEEKQYESTLHESNMDDYISLYQSLKAVRSRDENNNFTTTKNEDLVAAVEGTHTDLWSQSDEAYISSMDEAERERYRKHRSLIFAVGGAAVGALAGSLIEDIISGAGGVEVPDAPEVDDVDESLESVLDEREALIEEREGILSEIDEAEQRIVDLEAEAEASPDIAPELQQLFGELAGERVEITIPEGSNIWDQLELVVDQEAPGVDFDEKQRLVGNMVERLQQQYPGRNLDLVYPGETFVADLR